MGRERRGNSVTWQAIVIFQSLELCKQNNQKHHLPRHSPEQALGRRGIADTFHLRDLPMPNLSVFKGSWLDGSWTASPLGLDWDAQEQVGTAQEPTLHTRAEPACTAKAGA